MPKNHYREATTRFYDTESDKYLPAYPLIWTPSAEIESRFAKHYDVIIVQYADLYDLLGLLDVALYNFLQTYARINRFIKIREFSIKYKISDRNLVASIDRLQDCELIDRVCRIDHRGHPNDLILRPPRAPSELVKGYADKLKDNVKTEKTRLLRKELGKAFPGNDSNFSEKQITAALAGKRRFAEEFHNFCIEKNYKFYKTNPTATTKEFKDAVLGQVFYFCQKREIEYTDAVVDSALAICRHYGRRASTFH
ncbi:MAG TPA: hypothetical protein VF692_13720 [Pyrinomonadaceae bacterium]